MCRSYDSGLEMNGGVMYFTPALLALSHAYVSVRVFFPLYNEINRLVMVPIKPP